MNKMNRRSKVSGEIPSSAMGDIAFLLLVFFLVTTAFSTEKGLQLQLPELAQDQPETKVKVKSKDMLKVEVQANGAILVGFGTNRQPLPLDMLSARVRAELDDNPEKLIVQVKLDDDARYDFMIQVLDELKKARAPRIHIVNPLRS
ncbi:MAG: biopolymer transporter ExbD [Gemmatimonadetes bacterium]|nr:MAG: biopolymer transporter ExbD [Gemmatimonadota bacterium]